MKKTILAVSFIATCYNIHAQVPFIQWQRSLGGSALEEGAVIKPTPDSGFISLCMSTSSDGDFPTNKGLLDCWVVKLSEWGDIVWKKNLGGSADDVPTSIALTGDGGYILTCYSKSGDGDATVNHGNNDYWVVKIDDTGRIQWQKSYGGSGSDVAMTVQQTTDGGYVVGGYTESTDGDVTLNHGAADYWVIKLSATGSLVWQKSYGGSSDDMLASIQQTTDGGYILSGESSSNDGDVSVNHGGDDIWVVKISAIGAIEWQRSYGGSGDDEAGDDAYSGSIQQTIDSGYIISGETSSSDGDVTGFHGGTLFDAWAVKLDKTGALQWQKTLGGTNDDDGFYIQQTPDTGYIFACSAASVDGDITNKYGGFDYWMVKLSKTGTIDWQRNYGGTGVDIPYCVYPLSDSEFIVTGYSNSNDSEVSGNHGDYDAWVVKLAYCNLPVANAISGPSSVCIGSTIQLSDNTPGGTWSVSSGNATVSAGAVMAVNAGNVAVFYTKTNSCGTGGATQIITIDPLPTPVITATGSVLSVPAIYTGYQWLLNGSTIAGASNATYTDTTNGLYTIIVTDTNGCIGTAPTDTISDVGINNINSAIHCTILPNPTSGDIYIKGAGNVRIEIYNTLGQRIKTAENTNNISIAGFPSGIYFIKVSNEQGALIKQERILKE